MSPLSTTSLCNYLYIHFLSTCFQFHLFSLFSTMIYFCNVPFHIYNLLLFSSTPMLWCQPSSLPPPLFLVYTVGLCYILDGASNILPAASLSFCHTCLVPASYNIWREAVNLAFVHSMVRESLSENIHNL